MALLSGAPPDDTKTNWNAPGRVPGPEQSPIETYVIAPPDECDAAQASDPQDFSGDTGPSTCEAATGLLVWPRDCTDEGENTRIEEILRRMDPKTLTSTDSLCQLTDEVSFWITKISQENVEVLTAAVSRHDSNPNTLRKKIYGGTTSGNSKPIQIPAANEKFHLKKRAFLTVEKQELRPVDVQDPSLIFLSTPPGEPNLAYEYAYFAQGGEGITVYAMGSGLDLINLEAYWVTPTWIFAVDVPKTINDEDLRGHGSCMVSKIGGLMFGAAKKPKLKIVKTTWSIGSFSNALGRVQRDINKNRAEELVVYMPYNWTPSEDQDNDPSVIAIKRLLWSLGQIEVVIVVDAGAAHSGVTESVGLPAAFSLQYAIIAVGAVEAGYDSIFPPYTEKG